MTVIDRTPGTPLTYRQRIAHYRRQTGRRGLTNRQARRAVRKALRAAKRGA